MARRLSEVLKLYDWYQGISLLPFLWFKSYYDCVF